jgi:zinc transport system substrate-binding protein
MLRSILRHTLRLIPLALVIGLVFAGCKRTTTGQWPAKEGPKVAVSFAPLYCFTANITGDRGTVKSVLSTQGPHHADTSIQERVLLEEADLFVFNGLGLDDAFAQKLKSSTSNGKLKMLDLGKKLEADKETHGLLLGPDGIPCEHEGHDHAHHDHDPHMWLSPVIAGKMVEEIRYSLRGLEPDQKEMYDRNAAAYQAKLKAILDDGKAMLKGKTQRSFVTAHGSMQYFAKDFGLTIAGSLQARAGEEPSPTELKALIEKCLKETVTVIAVEPQYATHSSPKLLKEALEAGGLKDVAIIEVDPLETATATELTPDWYERKMRANLGNLAKVLK